jgi:integrase
MRGSVRKRGSGWQLRVYVGQHAGKDVNRSRTVRGSKREAEAELRKFLDEVERQVGHDDHHVTVEQLFNRWWPRHKHDLAAATVTTHEGDFRRHILPHLGEQRVVDVRGRHLDAWMAELLDAGLKANYVADLHCRLSPLFTQAVKWEIIATNPCRQSTPPKRTKKPPVAPTAEELSAIVATAEAEGEHMLATYVAVAAAIGARRGEMCGLRWSDVDLDTGAIRVVRSITKVAGGHQVKSTKTGSVSGGAISASTVERLRSWRSKVEANLALVGGELSPDAYVFSPEVEGMVPYYPDSISHRFRVVRDAAGVRKEISVNALRHFHATTVIAAGVDPRTVASRLGHSSPNLTLSTYAASIPATDRAAAELIDLGD